MRITWSGRVCNGYTRRPDLGITSISVSASMRPSASARPFVLTFVVTISLAPVAFAVRGAAAAAPQVDPFRFQLLGPSGGGRFSAVTGVPGDYKTWYLGAA